MPPRPPARAQSTSRTPPTHTLSASATPSSSSPVDLGQPTTSAIEGVQPSPRYGVLRGHTPAREIPPPPVPMHASPSMPSPVAFLRRLRDTPQPEEPAQTPNVAAVPTESRGTTDSEIASVSDEQRVPEAAPVRNTSIPLAAFVPDELQDAAATPSHVLAERQGSAAPEPSHVLSASWEAPEPSHALSASQETITPESSHIPDALREACCSRAISCPEALRDAVAPEPSHVLSASRDTAAPGSSHVPDTSQEAAVPEQFHVPDASQDAVAPELSHVPDASRDAAAPEPSRDPGVSRESTDSESSHVPKPSHESQGAAYFDQAHIRDAPRTPDSSDSEQNMDTDSIQQDEIVASDPLERDTFPLIYPPRVPYPELRSARHFTATYRRLLALDPSDHMGDLIERTTILMGIILDFHTDLSYIRDGLSKHRQSHEQKTTTSS
ncbi:hypothetical protein EDB84DRAFT_1445142 [Lactarius hengduanensis]|nr:hypothetical protein EDB84DRAFT_1445142 [Lactarius hengduanensis]